MRIFGKQFPSRDEVIPIFATIVFPIYSWAIFRLLWNLPSWLKDLFSAWDMLILAAYGLAFALIECLAILGFMLFLSIALPAKYLKDKFVAQGSAMLWMLFILAIIGQYSTALYASSRSSEQFTIYTAAILVAFSIILIAVAPRFLVYRSTKLERFFISLADKVTIFLFIYVPAGILSLIIVFLRNIP